MRSPDTNEWERIGRWVMEQEADRKLKFLADIVSGPLDADKLDYVFRDGYSAGIPVGYDRERLVATICVVVIPESSKSTMSACLRMTPRIEAPFLNLQ
jgi:HD superfamily phosphohydrolase